MALKIKWSDDRVKGTVTALLLISRDRLQRGLAEDVITASLAEYRADPDGYKQSKKTWPDVRENGALKHPQYVAYYQKLVADTDKLLAKWTQAKRQFNSLLELDNALIASLKSYACAGRQAGTRRRGGESLGNASLNPRLP